VSARAARRPRPVASVSLPSVTSGGGASASASTATQRALIAVEQVANEAGRAPGFRADLIVGLNRVPNPTGRRALAVQVFPTVADGSFCAAYNPDDGNPHPHREVWVTLAGVDQPGAYVVIL
jgi:hypothetical protein